MSAKDSERLGTIRMITSAIKQREVDERIHARRHPGAGGGREDDQDAQESIAQFQSGGREDLVAQGTEGNRPAADLYAAAASATRKLDALIAEAIANRRDFHQGNGQGGHGLFEQKARAAPTWRTEGAQRLKQTRRLIRFPASVCRTSTTGPFPNLSARNRGEDAGLVSLASPRAKRPAASSGAFFARLRARRSRHMLTRRSGTQQRRGGEAPCRTPNHSTAIRPSRSLHGRRIPQHFIDELVSRADIVELIGSRVPLKKHREGVQSLLPVPRRENAVVHGGAGQAVLSHCFGCGARGTALGFLMEHDHPRASSRPSRIWRPASELEVPREEHGAATPPSPTGSLVRDARESRRLVSRGADGVTARGRTTSRRAD